MSTRLDTLYELGPSRHDPSMPIFLRTGRTKTSVDDPVMANTVHITAASLTSFFHEGLCCKVQCQNFDDNDDDDDGGGDDDEHDLLYNPMTLHRKGL